MSLIYKMSDKTYAYADDVDITSTSLKEQGKKYNWKDIVRDDNDKGLIDSLVSTFRI